MSDIAHRLDNFSVEYQKDVNLPYEGAQSIRNLREAITNTIAFLKSGEQHPATHDPQDDDTRLHFEETDVDNQVDLIQQVLKESGE